MTNHSELKELFVKNTNGKTIITPPPSEPSRHELIGYYRPPRIVIRDGVMVEDKE